MTPRQIFEALFCVLYTFDQGSACAEPTLISKIWVPISTGFQVGTPKSGFRANWAKLGSVTVLKKEILKVDDLDNVLTKIRNI